MRLSPSASWRPRASRAALAQLVEHIIRNDGVRCSSHLSGTNYLFAFPIIFALTPAGKARLQGNIREPKPRIERLNSRNTPGIVLIWCEAFPTRFARVGLPL
ncbi:hypothetical protein MESS2_1030151 [Mesorhizobium metallidurans STM 2683]|uniref:Uncharacterized protein n=1 Tax=Mesorhizobium metallidurans STM 2683 TaxID=1297569 RepID=M5EF44_9HYPH|nr:hypothetical protein MESS2_1030151 [Mesorhizobium metallidurans STM 2683]